MSKMAMPIVVADASGSMGGHGKTALVRNLINHAREQAQHVRGPAWPGQPIIVRWSAAVEVVPVSPDEDLPLWAVEGRASVAPLLALIDSLLSGDGRAPVLLLSDGHLASADVAAFKAWRRQRPRISVRGLAVGPDAAPGTLAKITGADGVFPPDEIVAALTSWSGQEDLPLPMSLTDITRRTEPNAG